MTYFEHHGSGLHRLIYISRSTMATDGSADAEIADIVASSSQRNRAVAVTGVLLAYNGWFIQALEGSYDTLKPLYDHISTDPRHSDVILKIVEPAATRLFSRWGMKQGRAPAEGVGFDVASAKAKDLLQLLKLAALSTVRRAA